VVPDHQADQVAEAMEKFLSLAEGLSEEIVKLPSAKTGKALRGARKRAGLSQAQLAAQLAQGIKDGKIKYIQRHISQMETMARKISEDEAKVLAEILNTFPGVFL